VGVEAIFRNAFTPVKLIQSAEQRFFRAGGPGCSHLPLDSSG
jgi:hypothetical protein